MESSEYLYHQPCTIYDRTGAVAWSGDELSEIWNMKMVEYSHILLYFEDCIRLFDFSEIKIPKTSEMEFFIYEINFIKSSKKVYIKVGFFLFTLLD